MRTRVTEMLGIEFPILAFSHCRDVVAAVTNAGGFGVLGATALTPEELDVQLDWIDERVDGRPYGLDLIVPNAFEGKGEDVDMRALRGRIPQQYWDFLDSVLAKYGLPPEAAADTDGRTEPMFADKNVDALLAVAFSHPIKLVANALGIPPQF